MGIHENLGQAAAAAKQYIKRVCKWDNVKMSDVKLFGYDIAPIEEEVSQIHVFDTQGVEGPLFFLANAFDLLDDNTEDSQEF